MVPGKEPGKKLLHSENAIQQERADEAEEYKTLRILLAGHLRIRINRGNAINHPLNRKTKTIKCRLLPGKDPFHVPAQRLHQGGDDDHKEHVLNCAKEIHQPYLEQPKQAVSKSITGSCAARLPFACVQLVECALQFFKLLSSLAQLTFRCQTLVVGKLSGGFRDKPVEIRCGLGRCSGCRCSSHRFRRE